MKLVIRNAEVSDYESLLTLFSQVHDLHVSLRPDLYNDHSNPVGLKLFEHQLNDETYHIYVGTIEDEIVGVGVMKVEEITENSFVKARKVLVIQSLAVLQGQRKKGIGRELMEHAFDLGRSLSVDGIELGVSEGNAAAIEFYESLGMKTKSRKMEFLFD